MKILLGERTKIIATIGPASNEPQIIRGMIRAGVDGIRLNFSHGEIKTFGEIVKLIRNESKKTKKKHCYSG